MKQILSFFLVCVLLMGLSVPVMASEDSVTILYTNDIHTYIDNHLDEDSENGLTYTKLAALKNSMDDVLLVDAGDHIQGTAYGTSPRRSTAPVCSGK